MASFVLATRIGPVARKLSVEPGHERLIVPRLTVETALATLTVEAPPDTPNIVVAKACELVVVMRELVNVPPFRTKPEAASEPVVPALPRSSLLPALMMT